MRDGIKSIIDSPVADHDAFNRLHPEFLSEENASCLQTSQALLRATITRRIESLR